MAIDDIDELWLLVVGYMVPAIGWWMVLPCSGAKTHQEAQLSRQVQISDRSFKALNVNDLKSELHRAAKRLTHPLAQ